MPRDYAGKVAVVTGAGSGLGKALSAELARRGCSIALVDVNAEGLEAAERGLAPFGISLTRHCVDVASEPAVRHLASVVLEEHGAVDLLINNAGISISAPFEEIETVAFERVVRVNFMGVVHACRAFLPALRGRPGAQIVNVASAFAWMGYPGKTAYAASKGAVRAFSESLRLECAAAKIGVTVLYPGVLDTNIVVHGISASEEQRSREAAFLHARGIPLQTAARRAIDGMRGNPGRIVIGLDYRVMDAAARFSPRLAAWLAGRSAARSGF